MRRGEGMHHRVAVLAADGLSPFELAITVEVFGLSRPGLGAQWWYSFEVCAERPGVLGTRGAFDVIARNGLERLASADTVIVPGCPDLHRRPSVDLVAALRAAHARGARIVSICTGAFTLAATGLLDGRSATTHWRHASLLAQRFPHVTVDADALYLDHGDILTSAGTAAGIDLCLHIVRSDHGADVANRLARCMVVAGHREGGQAQFVERAVLPQITDQAVADAIAHVRADVGADLTLEALASIAHLSPRQFSRRFRAATGTSPGEWVLRERLEAGRALLERGDDRIDEIARRVGLPNVSGFRRQFRTEFGVPPAAYRRAFRKAAGGGPSPS